MNQPSKPGSLLATALILGGLLTVLSLACCAIVAVAALATPFPSRAATAPTLSPAPADASTPSSSSPQMTDLPGWLPDRKNLPAGMTMVEEKRTSNQQIAEQENNPAEYLKKLESFGRVEGFSREYGSTDPCRARGMRYVKMTLILHKDSAEAQQYVDWMEKTDSTADGFQKIATGDYGYQFWDSPSIEECPSAPDERMSLIFFRRGSVIAFIEVSAAAENNSDAEILAVAEQIAKTLDAHIQGK